MNSLNPKNKFCKQCRVGLVEVLLGLLDWRAGGRNGFSSQMKWNESEASIGRVLAIEVGITVNFILCLSSSLAYFFLLKVFSVCCTSFIK